MTLIYDATRIQERIDSPACDSVAWLLERPKVNVIYVPSTARDPDEIDLDHEIGDAKLPVIVDVEHFEQYFDNLNFAAELLGRIGEKYHHLRRGVYGWPIPRPAAHWGPGELVERASLAVDKLEGCIEFAVPVAYPVYDVRTNRGMTAWQDMLRAMWTVHHHLCQRLPVWVFWHGHFHDSTEWAPAYVGDIAAREMLEFLRFRADVIVKWGQYWLDGRAAFADELDQTRHGQADIDLMYTLYGETRND